MITEQIKKLSSVFTKGEDFVILEIFRDHLRIANLKFDKENEEVSVLGVKHHDISSLEQASPIVGKIRGLKRKNIIVALGPHLATTLYSSVSLFRENPKEVIEEAELDNVASQAIWKFFDRSRKSIAEKMNISDFDLIFTDARIRGIRLDGHKVVNPVGFVAKSIKISFSQTFLTRDCSDFIKEHLPTEKIVLIGEAGTLMSNALGSNLSNNKFILPVISANHTDIFIYKDQERKFWDVFPWGSENIIQFIVDQFSVSEEVAKKILDLYKQSDVSLIFAQRLERLLLKELGVFTNGITLALKRTKSDTLCIHNKTVLPELVFEPNFKKRFGVASNTFPVDIDDIGESLGLSVINRQKIDATLINSPSLYFFEWRLSPFHGKLEQSVMRRVRWLSPLVKSKTSVNV